MDTSISEEDSGTDEPIQPLEIEVTTDDPDEGDRQWLQSITTLLAQRSQESDPSPRVQFALDKMFIAACERVVRLLNGDLVDA
jgi:hypothetical protein